MSKGAEVRVAGREWLVELRAARDEGNQPRVADLLTEIAVQAPELQGAACEVVRGNNDAAADQREEWARGFFISATPQSLRATTTVTPAPVGGELRRFERRLGGAKPAANGAEPEVADALQAATAELTERAKPKLPESKPKPKEAKAPEADPANGPKAKAWPDTPQPPDGATELEKLTYPHGLLGHVVQYIVDTAQLPDRWMALAGALSVCAKALDRKVIGPRDNSVVLWTVLLSETGAGKQHILSCIRTILRAIGMENVLAASGIASLQSVEELLTGIPDKVEAQPSPLVDIDEYGSFLTRISSKGQTGNVSEIPSTLQTLWGWPPEDPWHGSIKVGKKVVDVYGPAFAIFGASTKRAFFSALKKKEVSSGFVNRHLLVDVGRGASRMVDPKYPRGACPSWLVKALKEIAGDPAPTDNRPLRPNVDGREVTLKDFRRIGWASPEILELWRDIDEGVRGMPSVEDRELWIRSPELALRIATVAAVFDGRKSVHAIDWRLGHAIAQQSMRQIQEGYQEHSLDEYEQADLVEHIRDEFRRKSVLTIGQIHKLCERKTGDYRKIDRAIAHLATVGDITELQPSEGRGRPTTKWEWARQGRK